MSLTDREKEEIKRLIDNNQPLPPKYKLSLFADAPEVELIWQGKSDEVTNVVLPFQSIEQIDEARREGIGEQIGLFAVDERRRQSSGWVNKLIWGDNRLVLSSLKNGPLRREIEAAGGLKLIYIDPPFDVGADFSIDIEIGDEVFTKRPSVIEEIAYNDTWGLGPQSYIAMMYERLRLMHGLLADNGSIYVHCDWRVDSMVRLVMDEVFGKENFLNEVIWCYKERERKLDFYNPKHDVIYFYAKNRSNTSRTFNWDKATSDYAAVTRSKFKYDDNDERGLYQIRGRNLQGSPIRAADGLNPEHERLHPGLTYRDYLEDREGVAPRDWWEIGIINKASDERLYYPTQKPQELVERIIAVSSNPGDLVADFFCGSGTTLAVAEKLGRRWIGCDLGRFAIHTTRKRLIGMQRQLKEQLQPYRSFEILNLGLYERQYYVGIDHRLPKEEQERQARDKQDKYLKLILEAYGAKRVTQTPPFHGSKGNAMVLVGPVDAPITLSQVREAVAACRRFGATRLDVLGFEFEMGLTPFVQDEAAALGVSVALKYIPRDVFDKRAVERGQVRFYDVAYIEIKPKVSGHSVTISLADYSVYYRQGDRDGLEGELKAGSSRVIVKDGQVVKVSKDKSGKYEEQQLTRQWSDWVDYWAVDFNFEDRKEIIAVQDAEGHEQQLWSGNYIFENEWQSFRTRKNRSLELTSASHSYPASGSYKVAVKVIDIFGNDTTKIVEVNI